MYCLWSALLPGIVLHACYCMTALQCACMGVCILQLLHPGVGLCMCWLVALGWNWGGRDCCVAGVSKNYTFNLITRKSIVVVGSFKLSQVFKKGERVPLMINYHYLILKHKLNVSRRGTKYNQGITESSISPENIYLHQTK